MICNNNYLADILRVCEIKDLIWVMRFQSPLVYNCCCFDSDNLLRFMKMVKCLSIFTAFLKKRNFISKIRRSKVTDYAALSKKDRKIPEIPN